MWPAVNVFTNSHMILPITKRDFFQLIAFTFINKYAKGALAQISTVFGPVYHVAFRRVFRNDGLETVSRFCILLRETFSNSVAFSLINTSGKSGVIQISALFHPIYLLLVEGSSETGLFRHVSNNGFQSV